MIANPAEGIASLIASLHNPDGSIAVEGFYDQMEALSELEAIVSVLESGDRPLNVSMSLFERGQALAGYCADILDKADLKVQQLGQLAHPRRGMKVQP